jgi:hypothetical protein
LAISQKSKPDQTLVSPIEGNPLKRAFAQKRPSMSR